MLFAVVEETVPEQVVEAVPTVLVPRLQALLTADHSSQLSNSAAVAAAAGSVPGLQGQDHFRQVMP
jgi:hypothetical protein